MRLGAFALIATCAMSILAVGVMVPEEGRRDRLRLAAGALLVRTLAATAIGLYLSRTGRSWLQPDEFSYLDEAKRVLRGGEASVYSYANFNAWLFDLTGVNPWVPRVINVILGAAVAVLVYEIVRLLTDRRCALVAGYAIALWPSLVLWSVLVLKDMLIVLALVAIFLMTLRAAKGSWWSLAAILPTTFALAELRPWAYVVVALAAALSLVLRIAIERTIRIQIIAVVLLIALVGPITGEGFLGGRFIATRLNFHNIKSSREGTSHGDTAFTDAPRDLTELIRGLPEGIFFNMAGPFPWEPEEKPAQLLALVEILVWYPTLLLGAIGLAKVRRRELATSWVVMLLFGMGAVVVLAIYESNSGTAIRQRAMLIPVVVPAAAVAVARFRDNRTRGRGELPPPDQAGAKPAPIQAKV